MDLQTLLGQWLNFKLFGITYLVGKISRSNFYFRVPFAKWETAFCFQVFRMAHPKWWIFCWKKKQSLDGQVLFVANSWSIVLKRTKEKPKEVIVTHVGGYKFQIVMYIYTSYVHVYMFLLLFFEIRWTDQHNFQIGWNRNIATSHFFWWGLGLTNTLLTHSHSIWIYLCSDWGSILQDWKPIQKWIYLQKKMTKKKITKLFMGDTSSFMVCSFQCHSFVFFFWGGGR